MKIWTKSKGRTRETDRQSTPSFCFIGRGELIGVGKRHTLSLMW